MRGSEEKQSSLFSYVSLEDRIPKRHPLRKIRKMVDEALLEMTDHFDAIYSTVGRRSIPPEQLLRALLLQVLHSVRSERLLMEHLEYNLLFRWFVGLGIDDKVWVPTVFSKNRDRLLKGEIAHVFFERILAQARRQKLISKEHFTVDGTLLEAWAGHKSFQPKDGPPPEDPGQYRGQKRSNDTHQSTTDPEAKLFRKGKGKEAKLSYMGHVVMENRHGLVVDARVTQATGRAEREAALEMMAEVPGTRRVTLGADKSYDTKDFVAGLRQLNVTPHVAQNTTNRRSAIDGRTTCRAGYAVSQKKRKQVEPIFGWMKTVGTLGKLRHRGQERVDWVFGFVASAFNLIRMSNLEAACAQ
jgi:transposase